jgi:predicted deacylase
MRGMMVLVFATLVPTAIASAQPATSTAPAGPARVIHADPPMIDSLDAASLPAGTHRFWFHAGTSALGQQWRTPVIVVRGSRPGPRLLLTASIHGDELNGIDVIHRLAQRLDPAQIAGTVTMVPGLNQPALANGTRNFSSRGGDGDTNLNRVMPGSIGAGSGPAERYAHRLWHQLMRPNADTAVDLHTQSRGTAYSFFVFAETARAQEIGRLFAPDVLRLDPGQRGTVENEMNVAGVPAITLEIGYPEIFDAAMNDRAIDGILRLMADLRMIDTRAAPPLPRPDATFVANNQLAVRVNDNGFLRLTVRLGERVTSGQTLGTLSDAFGRTIETYTAPVAGIVSTIPTNPIREAGDMVMRIGYHDPDPACVNGCG